MSGARTAVLPPSVPERLRGSGAGVLTTPGLLREAGPAAHAAGQGQRPGRNQAS